ncbi:RlpA-like double-psi beta-barrel-protein domain-containing protein-containing protein [Coniochaeta sp. 2T2.1]|nr:RlpA-like double-psi beta-barrel-protein domain-containing protein-containing protein [Coniochaeta sp. 2T2.1]
MASLAHRTFLARLGYLSLLLVLLPPLVQGIEGTSQQTGGNLSGGTCMFTNYTLPPGIYGSTMSGPNWNAGAMCGACLFVQGERGSVVAMVVDSCPSCPKSRVNLFSDAFPKVGDPSAGTIKIQWDIVSCGITGPIVLRNKTGSSKYWFEMQVLNANQPIASLDASTDGGKTWQPTTRKDYNYFQKAGGGGGFGTDTVTVRVTCQDGRRVIAPGVGVAGDTEWRTPVNC